MSKHFTENEQQFHDICTSRNNGNQQGVLLYVNNTHENTKIFFYTKLDYMYKHLQVVKNVCVLIFLACDICRFCVVIRFFIPATTANDIRLRRFSIPDFIHYIF